MTTKEELAQAIYKALTYDRNGKGGLVYTYNDFVDTPHHTIGIDGSINLHEFSELILKHLGFVQVGQGKSITKGTKSI